MDTIASATLAPPAELRHRRVRLELGSAAAASACAHVRSAIEAWSVPVNPAIAILLTSDLVINAVTNGAVDTITLVLRWSSGQFRVEIHDASVTGDSWETGESDDNASRGLLLATAMAAECGHYRTPAGRAVYYVLAPGARAPSASSREATSSRVEDPEFAPRGATAGGGEP
jgi:hypothetical protein